MNYSKDKDIILHFGACLALKTVEIPQDPRSHETNNISNRPTNVQVIQELEKKVFFNFGYGEDPNSLSPEILELDN